MHGLQTIAGIEARNKEAARIVAERQPAVQAAEAKDAALAPGTVGRTGDGMFFGRIGDHHSPFYPTYAMAESWVIGMKAGETKAA